MDILNARTKLFAFQSPPKAAKSVARWLQPFIYAVVLTPFCSLRVHVANDGARLRHGFENRLVCVLVPQAVQTGRAPQSISSPSFKPRFFFQFAQGKPLPSRPLKQ